MLKFSQPSTEIIFKEINQSQRLFQISLLSSFYFLIQTRLPRPYGTRSNTAFCEQFLRFICEDLPAAINLSTLNMEMHHLYHFFKEQDGASSYPSGIKLDYPVPIAIIYRHVLIYAWGDFTGVYLNPLNSDRP